MNGWDLELIRLRRISSQCLDLVARWLGPSGRVSDYDGVFKDRFER